MPEVMKDASPSMVDDCIVTDTGSTKTQVIKWADEILPRSATFVGGHPMAGREVSGPEAASADLFKNAFYCICPSVTAKPDAVKVVVGIAESVGAKPYFIDPDEHDSYVSFISHLPIIAASALVSSTNKSQGWREISRLVSTGYKDTTRLASGDPDMNRDICIYNREHLLNRIDDYIHELENWKELIRGDGAELGKLFGRVWEARERVMKGVDMTQEARKFEKIPSAADMLMGTYAKTKVNETIEKMKGRSSSSSAHGKKR
jgi:prephenate dehydrogenase